MRITDEEKAKNRASIVATAGRLFRERGVANVGIADLMREAGFTHGGFYNHFASKEALVAEIYAESAARDEATLGNLGGADADDVWRRFVDEYLSARHRDCPAEGCTLAALIGEASHDSEEVQKPLVCSNEWVIGAIGRYFMRRYRLDEGAARARAIDAWTQMLGAMTLSRAVVRADPALADEILAVCRARLSR